MTENLQRWTLAVLAHVRAAAGVVPVREAGRRAASSSCPRPRRRWTRCCSRTTAGGPTSLVTATEIFGGYFLALVVGVLLALVFTWSKTLESLLLPLLVSLNMIPKVALGPLIIVWFKYGIFPNSDDGVLDRVFPILLTTARGLREIEPDLLDLVRSLQGLALAVVHQDPAARRAALRLRRHEGGSDPGGGRRHRRRVPRLRQAAWAT